MESIEELSRLVREHVSQDTSSVPDQWSAENPMLGHCAIVSLIVQDYFGGEVLRGSLAESKDFSYLRSHYWNKLSSGEEVDITESQFLGAKPALDDIEERTKDQILSNPDTLRRYTVLTKRVAESV